MAGIMASDFWLVKKQNIDVPALYDPRGRYRYASYGGNWRAALAFLLAVGPNIPGLAQSINNSARITDGAKNLYTFDWLYGFVTSIVIYTATSKFFPARDTLVEHTTYGYEDTMGLEYHGDGYGHAEKGYQPRRESTGNPKGFGNINGLDTLGITRKSDDVRRASMASARSGSR